jgi:hypothetical protein
VGDQPFAAGHASAGVTAASTSWFLAEGATGPFFDLFVLLANPTATAADVEIRYLLADSTVLTKTYSVAPESRRTIYVDDETFGVQGRALANTTVSCAITSTNAVPIVVERSMRLPGPAVRRPSGPRPTTRQAPPRRRPAGCSPTAKPGAHAPPRRSC